MTLTEAIAIASRIVATLPRWFTKKLSACGEVGKSKKSEQLKLAIAEAVIAAYHVGVADGRLESLKEKP